MESPSGRGRTPRKRVRGQPLRGFKSHLHRRAGPSVRSACSAGELNVTSRTFAQVIMRQCAGMACAGSGEPPPLARIRRGAPSVRSARNRVLPASGGGLRCADLLGGLGQTGRVQGAGGVPGVRSGHGLRNCLGQQVLRLLPDLGRSDQRSHRPGREQHSQVHGGRRRIQQAVRQGHRPGHQHRRRSPGRLPVPDDDRGQPSVPRRVRLPPAAVLPEGLCPLQVPGHRTAARLAG